MDIWSILGLEPTRDVSAIKRAYAGKIRTCHPEDDPEGFMRLREAYQAALDYAQGESAAPAGQGTPDTEQEPDSEAQANNGWSLPDEPEDAPNPFADSAAIRQFLELYTGKQRKDSKRRSAAQTAQGQ